MCELKVGPTEPQKASGPSCISLDCREDRLFRVAPSAFPDRATVACLDHLGLGCSIGAAYTITPIGHAFAWALEALREKIAVRRLGWDPSLSLAVIPMSYFDPMLRLCLRSSHGSEDRWRPTPADLFFEDWVLA